MSFSKYLLIIVFALLQLSHVIGQIPVGTWRDHLPYIHGKTVAIANNRVYCATELALFYYDKGDASVNTLSKINKLSDLGIGYIAYSPSYDKLVIGYENGNVDILKDDIKYNFPDIKIKDIVADKNINHILIEGQYAYLSTGFGISVFDLDKNEFPSTYLYDAGITVNNTVIYNNNIYALTDNGVYKADLDNPILENPENWHKVDGLIYPNETYYSSTVFNNQLLLVNSINGTDTCIVNIFEGQLWDTIFTDKIGINTLSVTDDKLVVTHKVAVDVYNTNYDDVIRCDEAASSHAVIEGDDIWIARSWAGLINYKNDTYVKSISSNGPISEKVFKVFYNNGTMLVAPGGHAPTGENSYYTADVYVFDKDLWSALSSDADSRNKLNDLRDVVDFAAHQSSGHYVAATWRYGLFQVDNGKVTEVFNNDNTGNILGNTGGGLTYDNDGNLYVVSNNSERPFVVKTADNKWYNYKYHSGWATSCKKLINTDSNDKWAISSNGNGVFVWNDNLTHGYEPDDIYVKFDVKNEANAIISKRLNDIVQDIDGVIWVATDDGIAVYDNPEGALTDDGGFYARRPEIVVEGYLKSLLEGENVTSIAVDGSNRKWLGTEGGGLFLVSPDGTEQIMVWNVENSKLFSNNISSIDINHKTGEVFIGTDKGVQSYKSTATESSLDYSDIFAFPNPVKGDYDGLITIRGLMQGTDVKITDLSGHLVFATISNGGDAIWNGNDMSGDKVVSGIYLVLCTNVDGTQSEATKIMIIK